ncbi:MAG: cob(I)yrinic acid a,c-diamide adenosyltransferase [Candidatus Sungbacteria bacterium]|nr:cob(I)yrinic acid a,c-diamide adenosyltransferase [Candidatus Sungbacteria bacterium]
MLLVFTGDGKGKTTAALGQALRAVGEGKRVLMVQFIKGPWKSGEDKLLENLQFSIPPASPRLGRGRANFQIRKTGLGFVGILGDKRPIEEHQRAAEEGLELACREAESGNWDILILDEINNAVALDLLAKEKVLELINSLNSSTHKLEHLILTGRDAPEEFIDRADLVTEMKDVKHPYAKGIAAKRGLEY